MPREEQQPLLGVLINTSPVPKSAHVEFEDIHAVSEQSSFSQTMMNFLKGCIASGFLSLPYALSMSGYVVGSIAIAIIAVISTHCVHFLIESKEHLCAKHNLQHMSYGELARLSIGYWGGKLTNLALVVSQLGFCCVYALFYIENMEQVFPQLTRIEHTLILAPALVLLSWIKSLRILSFPSTLGTLCILYSAFVIYVYCAEHLIIGDTEASKPGNEPVVFDGIANFPIMFGNSIYAFEAIGLILPLQNGMKRKQDFPLMLNSAMVIVFVVYMSFALCGYLTFGSAVEGTITLSLPDNVLYNSVKVSLSVMMLQSYALQFYPAIIIMELSYLPNLELSVSHTWFVVVRHFIRAIFVAITVGIALVIPHIGLVISLIGALGAGSLGLILPPLIHVLAMQEVLTPARKALDWFYLAFGIIGSVAGTFVSIKGIVEAMT